MDENFIIRKAESIADYLACQDAQRKAWGLVDESYVIPLATMVGAQHHGGLVLGAFLASGEAVALSFAFLGRVKNDWCLYSQLTGVVPDYQGRGVGGKIKDYQRQYAKSLGLSFIAWAFDPLQSGNAFFNLQRLGATSNRYLPNMYGLRTDALNAGVATDRLIVEWPTDPESRREPFLYETNLPQLVEGPTVPISLRVEELAGEPHFLIEIPQAIALLRSGDPVLAEQWRAAISQGLSSAFARGYWAIDVLRAGDRSFYVLGIKALQ